jgi:hypothetical protein
MAMSLAMVRSFLLPVSASLLVAALATSCSLFSSKPVAEHTVPTISQEFDTDSGTWKPTTKIVVPPPSEPNATLTEAEEKARAENSLTHKVGRAVKKPLTWLPWHKEEAPQQ